MSDGNKKKSSPVVIILIVVAVVGALAVAGIGIFAALGIYGTRRYLTQAKSAEGKSSVMMLARGIQACAESGEALPASTPAVPAAVPSGTKYQSSPADWSAPAFHCAHFEMMSPQYFQYQWVATGPSSGTARASADLTASGTPVSFEVDVTCTPGATWTCQTGPLREK